jgi:hypothetical protein
MRHRFGYRHVTGTFFSAMISNRTGSDLPVSVVFDSHTFSINERDVTLIVFIHGSSRRRDQN